MCYPLSHSSCFVLLCLFFSCVLDFRLFVYWINQLPVYWLSAGVHLRLTWDSLESTPSILRVCHSLWLHLPLCIAPNYSITAAVHFLDSVLPVCSHPDYLSTTHSHALYCVSLRVSCASVPCSIVFAWPVFVLWTVYWIDDCLLPARTLGCLLDYSF